MAQEMVAMTSKLGVYRKSAALQSFRAFARI
jgi:hypothetical protein